jgi:predicted nucleic acid-binding Zn ribbon protein
MERAADFLGKALRRLDRPEAGLAWLSSSWSSIVGPALAAHTRPMRCIAGCLELAADGKAWQQQLEVMRRELCGRINQAWGASLVREVKFVAAAKRAFCAPDGSTGPGPKRLPHEADNEHTPFIRRRRA